MVHQSRCVAASGIQPGLKSGRQASARGGILAILGLLFTSAAGAEPVKFDWRFIAEKDGQIESEATPAPHLDNAPNPVVLPIPESVEEEESSAGWHWLKPKIAGSPGENWDSDRAAIQLAEQAQETEMARRNSPLNTLLPGSLSGLAPMGVESGIELRF